MINEYGGINHIDVSNTKPNSVIASHASRVNICTPKSFMFCKAFNFRFIQINIYDSQTKASIKTFSFTENVYSASFRNDGSLVCIGFEDNNAKIFPLLDAANFEKSDENDAPASKAKKRPLRKFDDHLG